ncbi:MAG: hypothetical protein JO348_13905 [Alphaproteobacteria bacterium]|nr:hypothetical protein [Alphaproteobacteria bacterium]
MRRLLAALAIATLAAATATASAAAPQLICKVDKVSAVVERGHLVITASGAVRTGGWTLPRLRWKQVRIPESDTEVYEFIASPPLANAMVIQALLPVTATGTFPLPRYGTTKIKIVAETNSVTVAYGAAPMTGSATAAARPPKPYR